MARLLAALLVFAALAAGAAAGGDWQFGRATFYGTDAWSIHKGVCAFPRVPRLSLQPLDRTRRSRPLPPLCPPPPHTHRQLRLWLPRLPLCHW